MQIADHLSAQNPEVVNVFPNGFPGQSEVDQMFQEGPEPGLWAGPSSFWATRQGLYKARCPRAGVPIQLELNQAK